MSVYYDCDSKVLSLGENADVTLAEIRKFAAAGKGIHDVVRSIAIRLHADLSEGTMAELYRVLEEVRVEERVPGLYRGQD
jgi:hypothetical protein